MSECVTFLTEVWGYLVAGGILLVALAGYGALKLKDFLPVLKTLFSVSQEYPLGTWNCHWKHDPLDALQRPDIKDVVAINFAREEIVIGSGSGGELQEGYRLVGRCTSSCIALTYRINDRGRSYAGSVALHKVTEKKLEGRFVQYIVAPDGNTAGVLTGSTVWTKA
jgi:hypothetical protein